MAWRRYPCGPNFPINLSVTSRPPTFKFNYAHHSAPVRWAPSDSFGGLKWGASAGFLTSTTSLTSKKLKQTKTEELALVEGFPFQFWKSSFCTIVSVNANHLASTRSAANQSWAQPGSYFDVEADVNNWGVTFLRWCAHEPSFLQMTAVTSLWTNQTHRCSHLNLSSGLCLAVGSCSAFLSFPLFSQPNRKTWILGVFAILYTNEWILRVFSTSVHDLQSALVNQKQTKRS